MNKPHAIHSSAEMTDEQLDGVVGGGKSQQAFDILIEHGDELTFHEQVACAYVWLTGSVKAGPNGEGDYLPGGGAPNPLG